ncbi:hypothetical protein TEA_005501 [Camellia sinensis var. sinensis]|uniref:cytochrome-b5 reductase n=1 Tax=Camellia sinensis var. sinensis TaxID=542762 RepID=A0A4S4EFF4_CAMSN|nr:hypothetical protein TEA_005501 [Camellia sinensis var. sinensis]
MRMEVLQSQRVELMVGIAFALVAVGAGTAYYFYLSNKNKPKGCLDPENFKKFKLVKHTQLSHNVAKFRFDLPTPTSVLGLPIGQHMSCRGKDSQGDVIKPYTPTTLDSDVGYFELVIKMYPQGRMSHHFREMREGDYLAMKGPKVNFLPLSSIMVIGIWIITFRARKACRFKVLEGIRKVVGVWGLNTKTYCSALTFLKKGRFKYQPGQVRAFGMLAGGTGITPMFQEELANLACSFPNRFNVYCVLNQPPEGWDGGVGFVSKEMIQAHCPAPASDIQILRCGPPPMNKAMAAHLEALGYASQMQFQF